MAQKLMRQKNWLCRLRVSFARHYGVRMCCCLIGQGIHQVAYLSRGIANGITYPHAKQRRDLVITGTTGAQATAHLWAYNLDKPALHCTVDVLIRGRWAELTRGHLLA